MDKVSWDKRNLLSQRVEMFNRIPGSALDLSQYVKKYDIDRNGRLKADASGELYFENAPGEKVRLRGFNFVSGSWEDRFYTFTKAEIEEFAEQIRLAGMNILRFHFLDNRYTYRESTACRSRERTGRILRKFTFRKALTSSRSTPHSPSVITIF